MSDKKALKLEVYNAIIEDFNKLNSFSRKAENELKHKYRSIPSSTLGSIISLLIQRSMKQNYRKSPVISSKYHELYEELMKDKNRENIIMRLSECQGISPALFARSLLQNVYSDSTMTKKCMKDTTLIEDKDLAYQVFLGVMNDNQYGPFADIVKHETKGQEDEELDSEIAEQKDKEFDNQTEEQEDNELDSETEEREDKERKDKELDSDIEGVEDRELDDQLMI